MHVLIMALAIGFIALGLTIVAGAFLKPVLLVYGLTPPVGLFLALGGAALLALERIALAVMRMAEILNTSPKRMPADKGPMRPNAKAGENRDGAKADDAPGNADGRVVPRDDGEKPPADTPKAATGEDIAPNGEGRARAAPVRPGEVAKPEEETRRESGMHRDAENDALYVTEETTLRDLPARVLSDGSIEARLPEGWLRFENMEHLNEYVDALEDLRGKGLI